MIRKYGEYFAVMHEMEKGRCLTCLFLPEGCSVAVQFLFQFTPLLRFQRERGGGACQKACDADRFTGFDTPAIVAGFDTGQ